jgi:hypothetical protein
MNCLEGRYSKDELQGFRGILDMLPWLHKTTRCGYLWIALHVLWVALNLHRQEAKAMGQKKDTPKVKGFIQLYNIYIYMYTYYIYI